MATERSLLVLALIELMLAPKCLGGALRQLHSVMFYDCNLPRRDVASCNPDYVLSVANSKFDGAR